MEPYQARLTFIAFLALSASIVFNALYLQADPGLAARTPYRSAANEPQTLAGEFDAASDSIRAIERELGERHYFIGRADGREDAVLIGAIMAYQYDHHLEVTGLATDTLLKSFLFGIDADAGEGTPVVRGETARRLLAEVQGILSGQGYYGAEIDGLLGANTAEAIRRFETDRGLPVTGRVSGLLIQEMSRMTGIVFSGRASG